MKIVFMGTPGFAVPSLRRLADAGYDIVGVITAPDRPAGRGQKLRPSPIKEFAEERNFRVLQPEKLKNPEFLAELRALEPDLAVVVAFRMLPEVVWSVPKQGTFNLHASRLPDYRGAAPINWVIINGEKKTGTTTFFIDQKIDTGELLLQEELAIPKDWTAGDLHDAMMEKGADLVLDTVRLIESGKANPVPQDHSQYIHKAPKIFKEGCQIKWNRPTADLHNFIRGLSPYPTAWTTLNEKFLKIFFARPWEDASTQPAPGTLQTDGKELLAVATADGWLKIESLQLEGKKRLSTEDFLRGFKFEGNEILK